MEKRPVAKAAIKAQAAASPKCVQPPAESGTQTLVPQRASAESQGSAEKQPMRKGIERGSVRAGEAARPHRT